MTLASKIFLGTGGAPLTILMIMAISTASVIGIKFLYQHLNPVANTKTIQGTEFQVGSTIEDVAGFTSHVEEYTKHIVR